LAPIADLRCKFAGQRWVLWRPLPERRPGVAWELWLLAPGLAPRVTCFPAVRIMKGVLVMTRAL
jgi:hypothetical protein